MRFALIQIVLALSLASDVQSFLSGFSSEHGRILKVNFSQQLSKQHFQNQVGQRCPSLYGSKLQLEEIQRPDPSTLISSKDETTQKVAIAIIATSLFGGTYAFTQLLTSVEDILPDGWVSFCLKYLCPVPLGLIFSAAGAAHFTVKDAFAAIVPPQGTWGGLWNVPSPYSDKLGLSYADHHTYWTGVAELGGGILLIGSGLGFVDIPVNVPAALLGLLVFVVTPANVYMFTHDAVMGDEIPRIPYPEGHMFRLALQCVLLSIFWKMSFQ